MSNPEPRPPLGPWDPGSPGTQTQMPAVVYSQVRPTAVHYPAITHTHAHTLGNIRALWVRVEERDHGPLDANTCTGLF